MSSHILSQGSLRSIEAYISTKLITIHPNPGPRDKTEDGKRRRRERRYEKRREKRKKQTKELDVLKIATWNVQKMSLGTRNKRKAKSVADFTNKMKWDCVLLSEVRAETKGTTWLGGDDNQAAIVFTNKAAILLRGDLLEAWCQEGQMIKYKERSIAVKMKNIVLIATYLPVYRGNNEEEVEAAKEDIKILSQWATKDDILIIGGDFNVHVGGGEERPNVCGKFGIGNTNHQGQMLLDWCEDQELVYVNSYFNHRRRGTWFHQILSRWYELDGFLMKGNQRHKHAKKISTIREASLSDHKPKLLRIELDCKLKKLKKEKRQPRIKWENLRDPENKRKYREKIDELLEANEDNTMNNNSNTTNWNEITDIVTAAAKEVCGVTEKKIENPWMVDKDEQVAGMRTRITLAIEARNDLKEKKRNNTDEENIAENVDERLRNSIEELKRARTDLKRKTRQWEIEWWQNIIDACEDASNRGDMGTVYKTLKQLGMRGIKTAPNTTTLTRDDFKKQFKEISENRFENSPEDIDNAIDEVEDIRETAIASHWREMLEETPSKEEILKQMSLMRESAPGKDGVRLIYLQEAGPEILDKLATMIQFMFENEAERWEESLKIGLMIPLHKKGGINIPNNYRGVVLLAMGSRILARVMASRLRLWAEALNLLDEEQAGFRKGRSTADVTQIMVRIQEDSVDLKRRAEAAGVEIEDDDKPAARLLDLRKAYPRVNKYAMWRILERYGMGVKCLRTLKNLHETTEYRIKSREGESEGWKPERGLREGCPSSPILFNIYHQVPMRIATKNRKRKAEEMNTEMGLVFKWIPGSFFPNTDKMERMNSEAKRVKIDKGLFADDTSKLGKQKELEEGVRITKEAMARLEERNNDDKEESLLFGETDQDNVRMLGSYVNITEDLKQRVKRAGHSWSRVRPRLKGSKLPKKMQANLVEACVESTALFDCQTRTWQQRDLKKVQSCVDRMYRHIWSSKTKPPLIEMQEKGVNMQDIRNELDVKTIRWKVEKRVYERIGHVMRMDDDRQVKAAILGWMEDLESFNKMPGRKRKTVLYWKRLLKEAGVDYTKIGALTKDRDGWKGIVNRRMKHLLEWEKQGGKRSNGVRPVRNQIRTETEDDLKCEYEACGQIFKSKGGLTNHRKRIHEVSKQKVMFTCNDCKEKFSQEANLKNHLKSCTGLQASDPSKKKCDKCLREYKKSGFSKHYKNCRAGDGQPRERVTVEARVYKAEEAPCDVCGIPQSKSNMSRHKRRYCTRGVAVFN